MAFFDIFKRKKKVVAPVNYDARVFKSTLDIFQDFGNNINMSDVVKICIDRIATHAAKLKPRYVKTQDDKTVLEKNGNLSYLLKFQPNPLMTPYDFIYRVVTLLYLNNNAFIYPVYDYETYELKELWPLKPTSGVERCISAFIFLIKKVSHFHTSPLFIFVDSMEWMMSLVAMVR